MIASGMTLKQVNANSQKVAVPLAFCLTQTYTALRKGQNRIKRNNSLKGYHKGRTHREHALK